MSIRGFFLFVLSIAATFALQCGNNPLEPEIRGDNEVWIQNGQFVPGTLTVSKGTTVKWTNKDNVTHTVDSGIPGQPTSDFNLRTLDPGDSDTHRFTEAGAFDYFCAIHGETGKIVVQ
ncbi:MAG: cupredoxin domain-containing protein [bacterium]